MLNTNVLQPERVTVAREPEPRMVTLAEWRLLERIRASRVATMFWLYAGGDGEPKLLFAYEDVKREDLSR